MDSNKKHNEKPNESKNYFKVKNNKDINEIGNKIRKLEINTNYINSKNNFKSTILTKELSKTLPNIKYDKDKDKNETEFISKTSKKRI